MTKSTKSAKSAKSKPQDRMIRIKDAAFIPSDVRMLSHIPDFTSRGTPESRIVVVVCVLGKVYIPAVNALEASQIIDDIIAHAKPCEGRVMPT